ncbi:Thioredoxin [Penicillium soppii]|uniref:Thioredoxin n=1 Tax=Penicillium soppii TaxID=69789 RepID=UPI0025493C50|nr:Thioredoxin [Penicillium soppii]KAJ5871846.1 Thioredoxin [Penicillium soppii]
MPVIEITSRAEFYEKILESKDAAILDCYAQWCPPCKAIAPKLEEWSEHYTDVKFYKVDVEAVPDVAQELNVTAMPTFMLFKGGEKVTEVVGAQAGVIENGIKTLLLGKE